MSGSDILKWTFHWIVRLSAYVLSMFVVVDLVYLIWHLPPNPEQYTAVRMLLSSIVLGMACIVTAALTQEWADL